MELKEVLQLIPARTLGVRAPIKIKSISNLGMGECHLNYLIRIDKKKFIVRININKDDPDKSRREYLALKTVEHLNIAPKVYYLHKATNKFKENFIVLDYIEGTAFRHKNRLYTEQEITQLARILAKTHNCKHTRLKLKGYKYKDFIKDSDKYFSKIKKYISKREYGQLRLMQRKIIKKIKNIPEKHVFGIIHNDICPQNIVKTKTGLKLIDWESMSYSDTARDIAFLIIDMRLKPKSWRLFLKTYLKIRKDFTVLNRAKIYAKCITFIYVLWELLRAHEVKHKKLHKEYLKRTPVEKHFKEAKSWLRFFKALPL